MLYKWFVKVIREFGFVIVGFVDISGYMLLIKFYDLVWEL